MGILRNSLAIAAASLFFGSAVKAECAPSRVDVRGDFGAVRFSVEIADTPEERSRGLMFVESMPRFSGMLFIYEHVRPMSFWMRNTLIPLDLLFLSASGEIRHIHENAVPLDETPIRAPEPGLAVLEINGGLARQLGLSVGDVLRHPLMPQDRAIWPCDEK